MPDCRRARVPGGTYFFTVNTYRRRTFLTDADVRSALREAIGRLRLTHLFVIVGCSNFHRYVKPVAASRSGNIESLSGADLGK